MYEIYNIRDEINGIETQLVNTPPSEPEDELEEEVETEKDRELQEIFADLKSNPHKNVLNPNYQPSTPLKSSPSEGAKK